MSEQEISPVVLGVTGGIAAYKAAELCSALMREKVDVQVIMTANAQRFVSELVFRTLSRRPVVTSLWDNSGEWRPEHVALADSARLFVVAPATANFLAKFAHGIADDALSTFAATYHGRTLVAPAMNPLMWSHPACAANVETLRGRGVEFVGPVSGHVACGADGMGRLAPVEDILAAVLRALDPRQG